MRMLCTVNVPVHAGNRAIADGTMSKIIGTFLETWRPENAYFGVNAAGERTAYFVVDVKESSAMTLMLEPLFMQLDAKICVTPVMTPSEFQAGLNALAK